MRELVSAWAEAGSKSFAAVIGASRRCLISSGSKAGSNRHADTQRGGDEKHDEGRGQVGG